MRCGALPWFSVFALAVALGGPGRALAGAGPALHWVRAPDADSCIAPAALASAVEERLGGPIFASASSAELAVEGRVARSGAGAGFDVLLRVSDASGRVLGSRTLRSGDPDCHALDEALILVITLTLDPKAGLAGGGIALPPDVQARLDEALGLLDRAISRGDPVADAPTEARVSVTPPGAGPGVRPVAPPPPPRTEWSGAVLGGVSLGATPTPSWAVGLRVGMQPVEVPLFELTALFVGPSSRDVDTGVSANAQVQAWVAQVGLSLCSRRDGNLRVRLRLCGGAEGGVVRASGQGFVHDDMHVFPHVALVALLGIEFWLGRHMSLSAEVHGALPFTRPELAYETSTGVSSTVFLTTGLIGRGLLALTWTP